MRWCVLTAATQKRRREGERERERESAYHASGLLRRREGAARAGVMSKVEGCFVLSNHLDVVGTASGPNDTVLVTLEKGGVIQYKTSTQVKLRLFESE